MSYFLEAKLGLEGRLVDPTRCSIWLCPSDVWWDTASDVVHPTQKPQWLEKLWERKSWQNIYIDVGRTLYIIFLEREREKKLRVFVEVIHLLECTNIEAWWRSGGGCKLWPFVPSLKKHIFLWTHCSLTMISLKKCSSTAILPFV